MHNTITYLYINLVFIMKKNNFPNSQKYYANSISIPIYVSLKMIDQNRVIKTIKDYFKFNC